MATVRLTWVDNTWGETEQNIYRSSTPMDAEALPTPLAVIASDLEQYDDNTAVGGETYYYRVAAVYQGDLYVSDEVMVATV